jgi:hypothetical protein
MIRVLRGSKPVGGCQFIICVHRRSSAVDPSLIARIRVNPRKSVSESFSPFPRCRRGGKRCKAKGAKRHAASGTPYPNIPLFHHSSIPTLRPAGEISQYFRIPSFHVPKGVLLGILASWHLRAFRSKTHMPRAKMPRGPASDTCPHRNGPAPARKGRLCRHPSPVTIIRKKIA